MIVGFSIHFNNINNPNWDDVSVVVSYADDSKKEVAITPDDAVILSAGISMKNYDRVKQLLTLHIAESEE